MRKFRLFLLIAPLFLLSGALWFGGREYRNAILLNVADGEIPNPRKIASLLERGADVKTTNRHGDTPLHLAALAGTNVDNSATLKLLVKRGADANAANIDGDRPLHYAIMANNLISIRALLQCGAKTNAKSRRFGTPLHQATVELERETRKRSGWRIRAGEVVNILRHAESKRR